MRMLVVAILAVVASACAHSESGAWTTDSGIYGTDRHWGPASFICGIAYDLRYQGADALDYVDVGVRYADAFEARGADLGRPDRDGWRRPLLAVSGAGSLADAARLGHASGTVGGVCPNGPAGLPSLRGSVVRVSWHTASGDHEQRFQVDQVRGQMTLYAGDLSTDGQLRIVWGP